MINIRINPILWHGGPITIGWHGVCLVTALLLAYLILLREGYRKGIASDHITALFCWMTLVGYAGARLLYVFTHWPIYARQPVKILALHEGGWTVYGGVIVGILVVVVYAWRKRLPFWSLADAAVLAVTAGEIVGRIGCTLNGDVWWLPTRSTWGLVYWHPDASVPSHLRGVPLYPIPTMLQAWSAALFLLLLLLRRRSSPPGTLFLAYLVSYAVGRALISTWQPIPRLSFGLNVTQAVSLGVFGLALAFLFVNRARAQTRKVT